jgi:hypothetical protein
MYVHKPELTSVEIQQNKQKILFNAFLTLLVPHTDAACLPLSCRDCQSQRSQPGLQQYILLAERWHEVPYVEWKVTAYAFRE